MRTVGAAGPEAPTARPDCMTSNSGSDKPVPTPRKTVRRLKGLKLIGELLKHLGLNLRRAIRRKEAGSSATDRTGCQAAKRTTINNRKSALLCHGSRSFSRHALLHERIGCHDSFHKSRKAIPPLFHEIHRLVNCTLVIVLKAAAQSIDHQSFCKRS